MQKSVTIYQENTIKNQDGNIIRLDNEDSLKRYIQEVKKFPILTAKEEYDLAKDWAENQNLVAAQKLVSSHLRLVVKIAFGYRGYGLPTQDIISEGNLGLMQAVKKFKPDMGFKLATYAVWWIRASINEYILHSWSLVKIGTTAAQKKLFFNLKKIKAKIQGAEDRSLNNIEIQHIAEQLQVSPNEVKQMEQRISSHDSSLNSPLSIDEDSQFQDFIVDDKNNPEDNIINIQMNDYYKQMVDLGMQSLNDREKAIIQARYLTDDPETLENLAQQHHISRERVRQIEVRALEKLRDNLQHSLQLH